jgi:hypothetical protein
VAWEFWLARLMSWLVYFGKTYGDAARSNMISQVERVNDAYLLSFSFSAKAMFKQSYDRIKVYIIRAS